MSEENKCLADVLGERDHSLGGVLVPQEGGQAVVQRPPSHPSPGDATAPPIKKFVKFRL